jgi:hypothetical protein
MRDADKMSPAQLRALADQKQASLESIPPINSDIDWSSVIKQASGYVKQLADNGNIQDDDDMKQFLFEDVMLAVYGPDIFKWLNSQFR